MANPDPAKVAAESYAKATDAYAKNQTAQGMAAAQVADKVAAPDPLDAIKKKMAAGQALTPAEQKQLNDAMAKANGPMIATPGSPFPAPATLPPPQPNAQGILPYAPVVPKPADVSDKAATGARFATLNTKLQAGTITPAEQDELRSIMAGAKADLVAHPLDNLPLPSKEEAAKAFAAAKANGASGYLDPEASTASLDTGGPAVYRDFPTSTPTDTAAPVAPTTTTKKRSAVDDIIAGMKDETSKEGGPNIWDIIQAAAAGWNFQTPAYLERKKAKEAKTADIEKLSKTAQFEKALQEERLAAEGERSKADIASRERIAGLGGVGLPAGATKGQKLGVGLIQGIGK
jgi:hypothetical protein